MQMNQGPALSQLRDIHLPPAISDFPIAYGWWVLLVLGLTVIATVIYLIIKHRQKTAVKRMALALLDQHYKEYKADKNDGLFLQQCNQILKRYCLNHYPHAVSLSGPNWANFLICYSQKTKFSDDVINAISVGLYQKNCSYNSDDLYQACRSWLKNNKPFIIEPEQGATS